MLLQSFYKTIPIELLTPQKEIKKKKKNKDLYEEKKHTYKIEKP